MASSQHDFTGRCKWPKLYEHNLDRGFDNVKSKIDLYLPKEDLARLKALGSGVRPKLDMESGEMYVTFTRKYENKLYPKLGGLPAVFYEMKPYTGPIGNGSLVTCRVEIYDTKLGKGTRLIGVSVKELVEYKTEEADTSETLEVVPF